MSTAKDGGPAFPIVDYQGTPWLAPRESVWEVPDGQPIVNPGLSLRDYFAAKAMQARLARDTWKNPFTEADRACLAAESYADADAMLAAREK